MILERRKFLIGLIAAPFIVREGLLMPVKQLIVPQPIPLVSSASAVLQFSDDGNTWADGPVLNLEDPQIKTAFGLHRFWRAQLIGSGVSGGTVVLPAVAPTNEIAA